MLTTHVPLARLELIWLLTKKIASQISHSVKIMVSQISTPWLMSAWRALRDINSDSKPKLAFWRFKIVVFIYQQVQLFHYLNVTHVLLVISLRTTNSLAYLPSIFVFRMLNHHFNLSFSNALNVKKNIIQVTTWEFVTQMSTIVQHTMIRFVLIVLTLTSYQLPITNVTSK